VAETGASRLKALQSEMRARYVMETGAYQDLAGVVDFATTSELFAIGVSAARRGDAVLAERAAAELKRRAGSREGHSFKSDAAVMEKELLALIAQWGGRSEEALLRIREAVALERDLPPPLGPPRPIKPATELYGEILLEQGRPREAAAEFERALARWPNRSRGHLGLARATSALGDKAAARKHAERFLANWRRADADLPELKEIRGF
jgi:tetratricopeptide (TPR) repeat protein